MNIKHNTTHTHVWGWKLKSLQHADSIYSPTCHFLSVRFNLIASVLDGSMKAGSHGSCISRFYEEHTSTDDTSSAYYLCRRISVLHRYL